MSQKSAYVNTEIFRSSKNVWKKLLVLDGHISHTQSMVMLEFGEEHDIIIILCLPSHITHYLQALDRAFFKSSSITQNAIFLLKQPPHASSTERNLVK